jgi:hypothetical protein
MTGVDLHMIHISASEPSAGVRFVEVYAVRGFDVRTRELLCLLGEVF